jgi:FkbM family methyltransferase
VTTLPFMPTLTEAEVRRNTSRPSDEWLWQLSRLYARGYGWFKDRTGHNLKGLGFLLRRLRSDREFDAAGHRWFFDHRIGGTYMRLIAGGHNEPETHGLLEFIAGSSDRALTFVDIGANIGEMVIAMAAHPKVSNVIAFEPHPTCFDVCRKNLALNGLRGEVQQSLVGDGTPQPYVIDTRYAPTSGIRRDMRDVQLTPTARIDDVLRVENECVLLIDVEGAELDVLKGGRAFVSRTRPLIIFEYSALIQRRLFTLADVQGVLGAEYELYRLRLDGYLDRDLNDTWNCVAVHAESPFAPLCRLREVS